MEPVVVSEQGQYLLPKEEVGLEPENFSDAKKQIPNPNIKKPHD